MSVHSIEKLIISIKKNKFKSPCEKSVAPILILFLILSLWDIYLPQAKIRFFDFIALLLIFLWMIWKLFILKDGIFFQKQNYGLLVILSGWFLIFCVIGVIDSLNNVKTVAGVLSGVFLFCFFYSVILDVRHIIKAISAVIIIHGAFLIFQYSYYHIYDDVLHFYAFLGGEEPRALSLIFRPTGLFLEPAHYSISMLMLLSIRMMLKKCFDVLVIFSLGTIFLTLSLWGLVGGILFIIAFYRINKFYFTTIALVVLIVGIVGAFLFSVENFEYTKDNPFIRLLNLSEDSSAIVRYGGLFGLSDNKIDDFDLLFGRGISNQFHNFGANSLAFIINASGLVGVTILFIIVVSMIPLERRYVTFFLILLFLTNAFLLTTFFWWFCTALLMRSYQLQRETFENNENIPTVIRLA